MQEFPKCKMILCTDVTEDKQIVHSTDLFPKNCSNL